MSSVNLPKIESGMSNEVLVDVMQKFRRELEFLLYHIDDENISHIRADQITVGKLQANQIETSQLIVGTNITMGPGAVIDWTKVINKPVDLVYEAALASYITTGELSTALVPYLTFGNFNTLIAEDYIVTGKILANQIAAGLMSGVTIKTIPGTTGNHIRLEEQYMEFKTSSLRKLVIGFADEGNNEPYIAFGAGDGTGANQGMIAKDANGLAMVLTPSLGTAPVQGFMIYNSGTPGLPEGGLRFAPDSTVDFTGVNLIGISSTAKFV